MNHFSKENKITSGVILLGIFLLISPSSSKAVNLAWIFLFFWGLSAIFTQSLPSLWSQTDKALREALVWMTGVFTLGLLLKLMSTTYWGVLGHDISFELNSWVAALVAASLSLTTRLSKQQFFMVLIALWGSSIVALLRGYQYGAMNLALPTGAVAWGTAMALNLSVVSAMISVNFYKNSRMQTFLVVSGVLMFSAAIFVAGRKGAFPAVLWSMSVLTFFLFQRTQSIGNRLRLFALIVLVVLSAGLWANKTDTLIVGKTIDRLAIASQQIVNLIDPNREDVPPVKGTVNSRVHLYRVSAEVIGQSPWLGVGVEGRLKVVSESEATLGEPLYHVHNEFLHAWLAFGLPGLLASFCFPVGLVLAGIRLLKVAPASSLALIGLGLTHFLSGLSDVNTFRNYYVTFFATSLIIPFLLYKPGSLNRLPSSASG